MKNLVTFVMLIIGHQIIYTQTKLQILRTNIKTIDVREGNVLHEGVWEVSEKKSLDIYYTRRFKDALKVTFYSDIDSISFDLKQNEIIDFIILLNGKDSCRTQLKSLKSCKKVKSYTSDTIPFSLGRDNRIYLQGRINNSAPIMIMFDTGAEVTGIANEASDKLVKINFDGNAISVGSGGQTTVPTSSRNKVQIGNLVWDDEYIISASKKYGKAPAIIGYSLFSDKIVEIDYEKKFLIIHDELPDLRGFSIEDSKWKGYLPYLKVTLTVNKKLTTDWLIMDTGGAGTIFLNKNFMQQNQLYDQMEKISENLTTGVGENKTKNEIVILPEISFLNNTFNQIPIANERGSNKLSTTGNLIGMDLLKRFNTIIDYQKNNLYFKTNSLYNDKFKKPFTKTQLWLLGIGLLTIAIMMTTYIKRNFIY